MAKTNNKSRWLGNLVFAAAFAFLVYESGFLDRWTGAQVSAGEIASKLKTKEAQVIDVREQSEIAEGMLKVAKWIPLSGIQSQDPETLKKISNLDKKRPVYIYCRSGKRAGTVAEMLKSQGFTDVTNVGGFEDLKAAGLEAVTP